jgi:2EXR family
MSACIMPLFSFLPGEIRNKIFALVIPQSTSIAPCKSTSRLAGAEKLHSLEVAVRDENDAQHRPQIVFRELVVRNNEYVYEETEAQAYTALLQVDRAARQETAVQFYESNNFVFPGCYFLQMFLDRLSPTTLSYIWNLSISAYLNIYSPDWARTAPATHKCFSIEALWNWLACIGRCANLRFLNISLEATTCDVQSYLLDQFENYGRDAIGLLPRINVAFIACETCKDPKESQHWRWGSESGSHEWKVIHFIGNTQVRTRILYHKLHTLYT